MITAISKIISSPVVFHNRSVTVQGVCRTTHSTPFPHFLLQDETGVLICTPLNGELPKPGQHFEVEGTFSVDTPANSQIEVPRLEESTRTYLFHHEQCSIVGCEFYDTAIAA